VSGGLVAGGLVSYTQESHRVATTPPWRHHNDVAPRRYRRRGIARHCMANENRVKFLPRDAVHPLY